MVSILIKIVVIVVSAIAGGFFGAWFSYRFQSRKIVKVRRIAIVTTQHPYRKLLVNKA